MRARSLMPDRIAAAGPAGRRALCWRGEAVRQHLRGALQPGRRRRDLRGLPPPLPRAGGLRRVAAALLAAHPAREPPAHRGRRHRDRATTSRALASWDPTADPARRRSPSPRRGCCCRTSPASPPSWTSRPCATPWPTLGGDPAKSTRCSRWSSWSTTRSRWTPSRRRTPSRSTASSTTGATASATRSCAGASGRSRTSRSCPRTPASCTRSTSSTSRAWSSCPRRRRGRASRPCGARTPTPWWAPTRTRRWSTGIGVLGWGVGGIEAEAAMLGQPVSMLIPEVVGFRVCGALPEGATATDLVLTVTELLRARRGGQVRGVLRPRDRQPRPGRPRHHRQHVARVRRDLRDLPGRPGHARLPALHRADAKSASRWSRRT